MITNAYSLYDCKSLTYSPPFFAVTDGLATRMVADLAADLSTTVGRHPGDYTLYRVGSFDDASGELLPCNPRLHVTDVLALLPRVDRTADLFTGSGRANGEAIEGLK